jgi:hypothetical protein
LTKLYLIVTYFLTLTAAEDVRDQDSHKPKGETVDMTKFWERLENFALARAILPDGK